MSAYAHLDHILRLVETASTKEHAVNGIQPYLMEVGQQIDRQADEIAELRQRVQQLENRAAG